MMGYWAYNGCIKLFYLVFIIVMRKQRFQTLFVFLWRLENLLSEKVKSVGLLNLLISANATSLRRYVKTIEEKNSGLLAV